MKKQLYTMQEMADKIGVNKSSIYRYLKKNNIATATTKGNTRYYDETVLQRLKRHFKPSNSGSKQETLVATLQQQINDLKLALANEQKRSEEQLQQKDQQIASLHKLMDQNQQLLLNTQSENKRLLDNTTQNKDDSTVQTGEYSQKPDREDDQNNESQTNHQSKKWWQIFKN